jgi:prolyl-tRNA synthetase
MKYSELLGQSNKDEVKKYDSRSHELLIKAGFIDQLASGIYTQLPLGRKIIRKIEQIIREEMDAIGGQEVYMPSLQPKVLWETTGRWDTVDILFKLKGQHDNEYALGPTHEDVVTPLVKKFVRSYRDLPMALYHFSPKFRDEARAKSGILRGREFVMKDLYSFHETHEDFEKFYKLVMDAYLKAFARCGLTEVKITEASGGSFTKKNSHEFNIITKAGEVDLLYCSDCNFAQNTEVATLKEGDTCSDCHKGTLKIDRAIEIGNIFDLGTKYTEAVDFTVTNALGKRTYPFMGSYGIGVTRLLGAIVEVSNDEKGMILPKEATPFHVHLVNLKKDPEYADLVYRTLIAEKIEVLYDERTVSAGEKLSTSDLIGIPIRLVVSEKNKTDVEYKERNQNDGELFSVQEAISAINEYYQL